MIEDAKLQQLNISFSFDERQKDKLIINAHFDHTYYQLELTSHFDIDFQEFKNALLTKKFKLVGNNPEILKLKIFFTTFEFKNLQNITLNTLKQDIKHLKLSNTELTNQLNQITNQLKEQSLRNNYLEGLIKRIKQERLNQLEQTISGKIVQERLRQFEKKILNQVQSMLLQQFKDQDHKIQQEQKQINIYNLKKPLSHIEQQQKMEQFEQPNQQKFKPIKKENHQLKQSILIQKDQQRSQTQNSHYRFSSTHKHQYITLQNNNTKVSGYRLALVEGVVFEKGSSIRFRIGSNNGVTFVLKQDYSIKIGLGIRNLIIGNRYDIPNWNNPGHGCFFLNNVGVTFSHSDKQQNQVRTDLKYSLGDVIKFQRDGDELLWRNQTSKNEFKMKVKLNVDEWSQACFCVWLCNASVVQIINS